MDLAFAARSSLCSHRLTSVGVSLDQHLFCTFSDDKRFLSCPESTLVHSLCRWYDLFNSGYLSKRACAILFVRFLRPIDTVIGVPLSVSLAPHLDGGNADAYLRSGTRSSFVSRSTVEQALHFSLANTNVLARLSIIETAESSEQHRAITVNRSFLDETNISIGRLVLVVAHYACHCLGVFHGTSTIGHSIRSIERDWQRTFLLGHTLSSALHHRILGNDRRTHLRGNLGASPLRTDEN
jgi:hypothetical protein